MTELTNPLFEEEKEFLERKKLEYERALRGDVEQLKDQSVLVGKVALVGAGLAGGVWLLMKLAGGKKKRRKHSAEAQEHDAPASSKSARESAAAFVAADAADSGDTDDLGFGHSAPAPYVPAPEPLDDPFQDLPYDDSRRLPATHHFEQERTDDYVLLTEKRRSLASSLLTNFLQSDAGKVIIAQAAAVVLAVVTKKLNEFFPADKNADLATPPGYAPIVAPGENHVATPVSSAPDASSSSQPSA